MVSEIQTLTFQGVDVVDVNVETHLSNGIPAFIMVGLPDKTIAESKERVRAAINSLGLSTPAKRILINLAPADISKEGSQFDLPIACSLLASMGVLPAEKLANYIILGELSLDGRIKPISGVLPAAVGATARNKGIICPKQNGSEALWSGNKDILAVDNLISLVNHFKETQLIAPPVRVDIKNDISTQQLDLNEVKGLDSAKRALEIAAAGGHNLLLCGPPGAGKSMLASRLPTILPELTTKEMLECSMVYSIAGLIKDGHLQKNRPYRAPHHSCSMAAMIGGGVSRRIAPGEISLAHNGVLFLDELPEFPRAVIDALRQPIENKDVLISRSSNHVTYPANFQLIAAMNPCRCGYLEDSSRSCNKAPRCAVDYQSKISGPILDRIDIHIDVPAISPYEIDKGQGKSSKEILAKVNAARDFQHLRYKDLEFTTNSQIRNTNLEQFIILSEPAKQILNKAAETLKLSMRGYNKILKVSRTIADLEQSEIIHKHHIAEAISYRKMNFHKTGHG